MARIEVEPGYTVAPKYIELEEDEAICPECRGTGQVVWLYASTHHQYGHCFACYGNGKVAYCDLCKNQRHIIKHDAAVAWMDKLCLECIRRQLDAERQASHVE